MKILFITDLYPVQDNEKTTPKTLLNFVKEWEKSGYEIDIIKPNFILNSFVRKKPFYKSGKYKNIFNINYWTPFLGNILKKIPNYSVNSDTIVIAHMPSGILFADKLGVPFCAGIHNSDLEVLTNPLYKFHFRKRMKRALNNAKAIACRSYVIKNKLLKLFPEYEKKTFVIPSGIETKQTNRNLASSGLKVLTCANFKKRKNIDKVIRACQKNFELTVIGDGNIRKKLEKLDKNVKFTGWLKPDEVLNQMSLHDIFILPSVGETFGMVYLEAMSQGCITICTENDGIDGIIKDGENGFLTEPTVEGIKKVLERIKKLDPNERKVLVQNAISTVQKLTPSQCANDYLQKLLKIL